MRMPMLSLLGFGVVAATAFFGAGREEARAQTVTTSTDDHYAITDCDQVEIRFHHRDAVRSEEQFTVPRAQALRLVARPSTNGGMRVQGGTATNISLKLARPPRAIQS